MPEREGGGGGCLKRIVQPEGAGGLAASVVGLVVWNK